MDNWVVYYAVKCETEDIAKQKKQIVVKYLEDAGFGKIVGYKKDKKGQKYTLTAKVLVEAIGESQALAHLQSFPLASGFKKICIVKHFDYEIFCKKFKHDSVFAENAGKKKILILGTRVTEPSIDAGYYYLFAEKADEKKNPFWEVLSKVFAEPLFLQGSGDERIANIKKGLTKHSIIVSDLIYSCEYTGSSDDETLEFDSLPKPQSNLDDLKPLIKQADLVILNGGWASHGKGTLNYFVKFLKKWITRDKNDRYEHVGETGFVDLDGKKTRYIALDSTSGSNSKNIEKKIEEWRKRLLAIDPTLLP